MRFVCLLMMLTWFAPRAPAATLHLAEQGAPAAHVQLVSETDREVTVEFRVDILHADTLTEAGVEWIVSSLDGATLTTRPGWPELPQLAVWLRLASTNVSLEVVEITSVERELGIPRPVAAPQFRNRPDLGARYPAAEFYASEETYPPTVAELTCTGRAAESSLGLLTFHPVQYVAGSGKWLVSSRIRVRITSQTGRLDQGRAPRWTRASWVSPIVLNPADPGNDVTPLGPRMLVVTDAELLPALAPWLEWKQASGIAARTILFSDVASTANGLRNYLVQYVDTLDALPEYLTLVGDVDRIPAFFGVGGSLTDHPYSDLSGNDYLPDWSIGRVTCTNATALSAWVARVLAYERDGVTSTQPRATVFSSAAAIDPQHGIDIRNLLQQHGVSVNHLQEPQTGTLPLLTGALNLSPNLIFYIGHGHAQAWSSVNPDFSMSDLVGLQPLASANVISVACATADLDYPGESLAEAWLNSTAEFAPLSYVGATESTAFFYSDTLGISVLRAIFAEQIERLGPAVDYGRMMTATCFPQAPGGLTEETIQQFVLLGDPSLRVYSESPQALAVNVPTVIPLHTPDLTFTVTRAGVPLADAEVCVSSEPPGYYVLQRTGATGQAAFELNLSGPRTLQWAVTARNSLAARGTVQAIPASGAFLTALPLLVHDASGDGDGVLDRGESGTVRIALANAGTQPSETGLLDMHSRTANVQMAAAAVTVPVIQPHDTLELGTEIGFTVVDTAADGVSSLIDVIVHLPEDSMLIGTQSVTIRAPDLQFLNSEIREDSGDGDDNPEAGERLRLTLRWANHGGDAARQIAVTVQTSAAGIQLINSSNSAPVCQPGDTVSLSFRLRTDAELPRGVAVEFTYVTSGANLLTTQGSTAVAIGRIPVFMYVLDRSADNVIAVSDALTSLGVEHEQGGQLPAELSLYASIWIFSGIFPNQTALPWTAANRLAQYLDNGGCCYWEGGDVWAFDQQTPLHARFHIEGVQDGTSDAGPVTGEYGTIYDIYDFAYGGENSFIDQLSAGAGAQVLLRNARGGHEYPLAIAYADPRYRTIGCSVEIGGLLDAEYPITRVRLLSDFLRWFRIQSRADVFAPEIAHVPPPSPQPEFSIIRISADIQDVSGIAQAELRYRWNAQAEQIAPLQRVNGRFGITIAARNPGDVLSYSLSAVDSSMFGNRAESPDYQISISADDGVALSLVFDHMARPELAPRISTEGEAGWSLSAAEYGTHALELYGGGGTVRYDSWPFNARNLRNGEITVGCYLRAQAGDSARILGSVDGGRTFPEVIWTSAASPLTVAREGTLQLVDQRWLCGADSVVLRFEYSGHWYWRISSLFVGGETAPRTQPVKHLVIQPVGKQMGLFWEHTPGALYYIVRASNVTGTASTYLPVAVVKDSSYVDAEATKYEARFYMVDAVTKAGRPGAAVADDRGLRDATLRDCDLMWTEKRNRQRE